MQDANRPTLPMRTRWSAVRCQGRLQAPYALANLESLMGTNQESGVRWLRPRGWPERREMAFDALALAALASRTVVAAASTDAWETAKRGLAQLLGRGDAGQTELAERRLEQTREQLAEVPAADAEQAQTQLETTWQTRLLDLLEEHPETAADLQALVEQVQAQLPAGALSAAGHGVAAGRDVNITASGGGVAAGTIHGNVAPGNPTTPGPATY